MYKIFVYDDKLTNLLNFINANSEAEVKEIIDSCDGFYYLIVKTKDVNLEPDRQEAVDNLLNSHRIFLSKAKLLRVPGNDRMLAAKALYSDFKGAGCFFGNVKFEVKLGNSPCTLSYGLDELFLKNAPIAASENNAEDPAPDENITDDVFEEGDADSVYVCELFNIPWYAEVLKFDSL